MSLWVWIWLTISIAFEVAADYYVKIAANTLGENSKWIWVITFVFYNLMLVAWFLAVHYSKNITIPGTIWLVAGQLALVILGVCVFGEHVTFYQKIGMGLSLFALAFLCL